MRRGGGRLIPRWNHTRRRLALAVVTLAVAAAVAAYSARHFGASAESGELTPVVITDGIAPFRLGEDLTRAAALALRFDQAASYIGPGCDDRDQVTVVLPIGHGDMTVMAMADTPGVIGEIIATPSEALLTQTDRDRCIARTLEFAESLSARLGAPGAMIETRQPVSDEFHVPFGTEAQVVGRWFPGGRTCDLALIFKQRAH